MKLKNKIHSMEIVGTIRTDFYFFIKITSIFPYTVYCRKCLHGKYYVDHEIHRCLLLYKLHI